MQINNLILGTDYNATADTTAIDMQPYYSDSFRQELEDHLPLIKQQAIFTAVDEGTAYRYEYNFYGLLNEFKVEIYNHWLTMRLMDFTNASDWTQDHRGFLLPNYRQIEQILGHWRSETPTL